MCFLVVELRQQTNKDVKRSSKVHKIVQHIILQHKATVLVSDWPPAITMENFIPFVKLNNNMIIYMYLLPVKQHLQDYHFSRQAFST